MENLITLNPQNNSEEYPAYYWEAHEVTLGNEIEPGDYYVMCDDIAASKIYFKYTLLTADTLSMSTTSASQSSWDYSLYSPSSLSGSFNASAQTIGKPFIGSTELTGKFFTIDIYASTTYSGTYSRVGHYNGFGGYSLNFNSYVESGNTKFRFEHVNEPNFYAVSVDNLMGSYWSTTARGTVISNDYTLVSGFTSNLYEDLKVKGEGQAKIGKPPFYRFKQTTLTSFEIDDYHIYNGVNYEQVMTTETEFTVGNCSSAKMSFTTDSLSGEDIGKWINLFQKQEDDTTWQRKGVFLIDDVEKTGEERYKVTAYDPVCLFDVDISSYIYNLNTSCTIANLFNIVCEHIGVNGEDISSYPNASETIHTSLFGNGDMTARTLLGYIASITGRNAYADTQGIIKLYDIDWSYITPVITPYDYKEYTYSDYNVPDIQSVKVYTDGEDSGIIAGNGTNVLNITYNPLFYSEDQEEMYEKVQNILDVLDGDYVATYKPGTLELFNDRNCTLGSRFYVKKKDNTYEDFVVFSKTISPSGVTLTCLGNATRATAESTSSSSYNPSTGKYSQLNYDASGINIVSGQRGYRLETQEMTTTFKPSNVYFSDLDGNQSYISSTKLTIDKVSTERVDISDRLQTDYISTTAEQYWSYSKIFKQTFQPTNPGIGAYWLLTGTPTGTTYHWEVVKNDHIDLNQIVYTVSASEEYTYYICKEAYDAGSTIDLTKFTLLSENTWYKSTDNGSSSYYWAQSTSPVVTYADADKINAPQFNLFNNGDYYAVVNPYMEFDTSSNQYNGIEIITTNTGSNPNGAVRLTTNSASIFFGNYTITIDNTNGIVAHFNDGETSRQQILFS